MNNLNRRYILAVVSTSFGSGFQHGFHAGVINVAQKTIEDWIQTNKKERTQKTLSDKDLRIIWSVIVSIFSIGGVVGSLMTAVFAKRFGHKGGLIWNNFIMFLAALFLCTAKYARLFEMFIIGRFLIGVNVGLSSGLCPIYLSEIAPLSLRGSTASSYFLMYTSSVFLSQFFSLKHALGNKDYWPIIFALSLIPAIVQLVALLHCPESPRFLLITLDDESRATEALIWFRNRNTTHLEDELESIRDYKRLLKELPELSVKTMFTNRAYRSAWIISLAMVLCQQLCGIDAVIYFSTQILTDAGFSEASAQYATLSMGILMVLTTVLCLCIIDSIGRRKLFLLSFGGLAIDTIFVIIVLRLSQDDLVKQYMKYYTMTLVVLFVVWYALGTGAISWFITVELFHHIARPLAVSMTIPFNWIGNFAIALLFLHISDRLGPYHMFIGFMSFDLVFLFFIHIYLPETCGKASSDIIRIFFNIQPYVSTKSSTF